MRNIEFKARVADFDEARAGLATLEHRDEFELLQTDTFFHVRRGRLKLREFGADTSDGSGELIFYERPDKKGAKLSEYDRIPCDARIMLRALSNALGIRGVVKKRRSVILVGTTRIHFDQVDDLGHFVEIEVVLELSHTLADGEQVATKLLRAMNIPDSALVSGAYIDLLEERVTIIQ